MTSIPSMMHEKGVENGSTRATGKGPGVHATSWHFQYQYLRQNLSSLFGDLDFIFARTHGSDVNHSKKVLKTVIVTAWHSFS